jgi:phosphomannomutase
MLYYAVGKEGLAGGIMVTASHNPKEYIGFKLCRENAIPIGQGEGMEEIKQEIKKIEIESWEVEAILKSFAHAYSRNIIEGYKQFILQFIRSKRKVKVVVDTANGAVGPVFEKIFGKDDFLEIVKLYFEPDGNFPNHEPDPLKDKNLVDICRKVKEVGADFGVAFDGDGDRCIFIDERGERVRSDFITILLAKDALEEDKGQTVVYDIRSSKVVKEEIEKAGGIPVCSRIGHAFIKKLMRKKDAVVGGELSGHFYFRDMYYVDSGIMAFAKILNLYCKKRQKFSQLIQPFKKYFQSGEINFKVEDKQGMIQKISEIFSDARQSTIDGITIEYPNWWFNVRPSNTEPLLRLNLEADTRELLQEKKEQLFNILGKPV